MLAFGFYVAGIYGGGHGEARMAAVFLSVNSHMSPLLISVFGDGQEQVVCEKMRRWRLDHAAFPCASPRENHGDSANRSGRL
jgi:hypothetical protein